MISIQLEKGDFPVAERIMRQVLCLPIHAGIVEEQINYISHTLERVIEEIAVHEEKKPNNKQDLSQHKRDPLS
ncbi:MAG: DegT/DnrJ/EryC1/StrS family aminotransferase [Candidatus Bathyarchaeia archaeon]